MWARTATCRAFACEALAREWLVVRTHGPCSGSCCSPEELHRICSLSRPYHGMHSRRLRSAPARPIGVAAALSIFFGEVLSGPRVFNLVPTHDSKASKCVQFNKWCFWSFQPSETQSKSDYARPPKKAQNCAPVRPKSEAVPRHGRNTTKNWASRHVLLHCANSGT